MSEDELIELYCFVDDFCNRQGKEKCWIDAIKISGWFGRRGPKRRLSLPEVLTLNIMRIAMHVADLKSFHKLASNMYKDFFPGLPNYENFLKATNKSAPFITILTETLLRINRISGQESTYYIDSTDISVCENRRIQKHKVAKSVASRGKGTKGWFYGLRMQGVCDKFGEFKKVFLTTGSVTDNAAFEAATRGMKGVFVSDAGYLLKERQRIDMAESGRIPYTAPRKNMKRLASMPQIKMLHERNIIESAWSSLKGVYNIVYHKARSVKAIFRHIFYCLAAFLLSHMAAKLKLVEILLLA